MIDSDWPNRRRSMRPHRLAWPRTPPFHGGNGGSNPPGDAIPTRKPAPKFAQTYFPGDAAETQQHIRVSQSGSKRSDRTCSIPFHSLRL